MKYLLAFGLLVLLACSQPSLECVEDIDCTGRGGCSYGCWSEPPKEDAGATCVQANAPSFCVCMENKCVDGSRAPGMTEYRLVQACLRQGFLDRAECMVRTHEILNAT